MMQFRIRKLDTHDATEALQLAYSAAYESGLVTTEFDKNTFNFKVKSIFVQPNSESFGLFHDDVMTGFVAVLYDFLPWNDHKRMIVDFLYISAEHRNKHTYQLMIDHLTAVALQGDIKTIRSVASNFLLDHMDREILLKRNGLMAMDTVYEGQFND